MKYLRKSLNLKAKFKIFKIILKIKIKIFNATTNFNLIIMKKKYWKSQTYKFKMKKLKLKII